MRRASPRRAPRASASADRASARDSESGPARARRRGERLVEADERGARGRGKEADVARESGSGGSDVDGRGAARNAARGLGAYVAHAWEMQTVELSAELAARWPMCLAIAIDKTARARAWAMILFALILVWILSGLSQGADDSVLAAATLSHTLNPLTAFALGELNVLVTAFLVLYPVTFSQALIDEREGVEESNTLRSLKLPAIIAEFAVGSKVAVLRLGRAVVRDFALFMTIYLLAAEHWLTLDVDVIDRGIGASSVHQMEGGISVHSLSSLQ